VFVGQAALPSGARLRQRCVNEAGGDEVDSDGSELERQVGCESW
jgi:hypothetical protein